MNTTNEPSIAAVPASQALNEGRLWDLLNNEIDQIRSEQKQPGWSTWAILGALASAVWLFSKELGSCPDWIVISAAYMLFSLLIDAPKMLLTFLAPNSTDVGKTLRFEFTTKFSVHRKNFAFEALRFSLLLYLSSLSTHFLCPPFLLSYRIFYAFGLLLHMAVFLMSFVRLPVKTSSSPHPLLQFLLGVMPPLFGCYAACGLTLTAIAEHSFPTSDFRTGGLLCVATFLLSLLTESHGTTPLLNSLTQIRRNLALGKLDVQSAAQQIDVVLAGMRITDVFQKDLSILLQSLEEQRVELQAVRTLADLIEPSLNGTPEEVRLNLLPKEKQLLIDSLLTTMNAKLEAVSKREREIAPRATVFLAKMEGIRRQCSDNSSELLPVLDPLRLAVNQRKAAQAEVQTRIVAIRKKCSELQQCGILPLSASTQTKLPALPSA